MYVYKDNQLATLINKNVNTSILAGAIVIIILSTKAEVLLKLLICFYALALIGNTKVLSFSTKTVDSSIGLHFTNMAQRREK